MYKLSSEYEVTITEMNNKANDPSKYIETLQKVCTVQSAEELSYILHHLKSFKSSDSFNFNLFKKGISASWEHPANTNGCSWSVQIRCEVAKLLFERLASYFCLEGFKTFTCNGIKLNIRSNYVKFEIWSNNVPLVEDGQEVLQELQDSLGIEFSIEFSFKNHRQLLNKMNNRAKETIQTHD